MKSTYLKSPCKGLEVSKNRILSVMILMVFLTTATTFGAISDDPVSDHLLNIEMSTTSYYGTGTEILRYEFDAWIKVDDKVKDTGSLIVPNGKHFETWKSGSWLGFYIEGSDISLLDDFGGGVYTFVVNYIDGSSNSINVAYVDSNGDPLEPEPQIPEFTYPQNEAVDVPLNCTLTFHPSTDPQHGLEIFVEPCDDDSEALSYESELPYNSDSYGPIALSPNTCYSAEYTIGNAIWKDTDGIPTVIDTDAECEITFTTGNSISFPDYFPLDPTVHGIKTFEWTYGRTGSYQSYISGTHTVPYTSGAIEGIGIVNISDMNQLYATNDGSEVKWIAYTNNETELGDFATDCSVTGHPTFWAFSTVTDDMLLDEGIYYFVSPDLSQCEEVYDLSLLFDIQNVNISFHQYCDAVIIWYIDEEYPFKVLDFDGEDIDLGITLPDGTKTGGKSITHFDVYAYNVGLIAYGDIESSEGQLTELAELSGQFPYSSISGKAIDSQTGAPIAGINVEARRDSYNVNNITDADGYFELSQVPPGLMEIGVDGYSSGYTSLDQITVNVVAGENIANRYIALSNEFATVSGYVRYADGTVVPNAECYVDHHVYEEWTMTDETGKYEFHLPPGIYTLLIDELESQDSFVSTNANFVIHEDDIGHTITCPDITVFRQSEGYQITGTISNPDHYVADGSYGIVALKTGSNFADDAPYFYSQNYSVSEQEINPDNSFIINSLPAGNYDLYVVDASEDAYGIIESSKILGHSLNIPTGSHVDFEIEYGNSSITGKVMDSDNCPLVEADVILMDTTDAVIYYGTETDGSGAYELKNLLPGTYHLMAVHRRYHNVIKTVVVLENSQLVTGFNLDAINIPEAMDLSGNGSIALDDLILIGNNWLSEDYSRADFNIDNIVNLIDFSKMSEFWQWKALWNTTGECPVNMNAIYDIDTFTQYNGTYSFVDTFSDGLEPPSAPSGSSDYIVFGLFQSNRENGDKLELNMADGFHQDDSIELVSAVGDSSFFFNEGSEGSVSGVFEINHGFFNNSSLGVGIDNYQTPKPVGSPDESIGAGIIIDSDGSIYACWGHDHDDISNEYYQNITNELIGCKKITIQVLLDSSNRATAKFDYGSDGSFELVKPNYATLVYIAGTYTGTFQVDQWSCPSYD